MVDCVHISAGALTAAATRPALGKTSRVGSAGQRHIEAGQCLAFPSWFVYRALSAMAPSGGLQNSKCPHGGYVVPRTWPEAGHDSAGVHERVTGRLHRELF